jgi:hypothetical protein
MFTIETQPEHKLVRVKLSGMLTLEEVEEFYRQEHDAILRMGCALGEQIVLVDMTECPIQMQQIVSAFQNTMDRPDRAWRLAMVTGGSLSRIQARRVAQREYVAMFDTTAEAEAWLFAEAEQREV